MDLDDFRSILDTVGVDVWTFIDTAILVASLDYGTELKQRRDKIVERLYATCISNRCRNCDFGGRNTVEDGIVDVRVNKEKKNETKEEKSPCTPRSVNEEDDVDPFGGLFDDEQKRILEIKEQLEDPRQSEDSLVDLLQSLVDMDITFQALQDTDVGRHVNRLRKHPSNDVRRLVKHLVMKWKDIVDEWVRSNPPGEHASPELMVDGDSPQQKHRQNDRQHVKVPDFTSSPNPQNGSFGSNKNNLEPERKPNLKPKPVPPRREPPARPSPSAPTPPSIQRQREQRDSIVDSERLASASRRLQENYKEAENAKRQRTIQVMDIHELPKPKSRNAFFPKNKGGSSQGRHW